jgi:hypothetical protein
VNGWLSVVLFDYTAGSYVDHPHCWCKNVGMILKETGSLAGGDPLGLELANDPCFSAGRAVAEVGSLLRSEHHSWPGLPKGSTWTSASAQTTYGSKLPQHWKTSHTIKKTFPFVYFPAMVVISRRKYVDCLTYFVLCVIKNKARSSKETL